MLEAVPSVRASLPAANSQQSPADAAVRAVQAHSSTGQAAGCRFSLQALPHLALSLSLGALEPPREPQPAAAP